MARNPAERAFANPTSRRAAITGKCFTCMGEQPGAARLIRECPSAKTCSLYPVRPYQRKLTGNQSLKAAVKAKCWDCVGGNADPGPRRRVRDCEITDCPLWTVRPWQGIKGRQS